MSRQLNKRRYLSTIFPSFAKSNIAAPVYWLLNCVLDMTDNDFISKY